MKQYSIAIIGCGMIYKSHVRAIAQLPNARCAAVVDIIEAKAKAAGEEQNCPWFTDTREMLEKVPEIDICILALPTNIHGDYIALCAEYKKAVLCEKPFTFTEEDALRTEKLIAETGIHYMTAQVVRFWTGYVQIKKMLEAGELGEIYMSYFSRCSQRQSWDNYWLFDPQQGGGAMFDMMVHDIDYMNYLFGEADSVYSVASKDDTGCYDNVFASVTYKNGVKAVAETAFNMHTGYPFSMYAKVMGSLAAVELHYCAGFDINQRDSATAELRIFREGVEPEIVRLEQYDAYAAEIAYFIDCLEKGEQPMVVTPQQSLQVIRVVNAIKKSADSNTVVKL